MPSAGRRQKKKSRRTAAQQYTCETATLSFKAAISLRLQTYNDLQGHGSRWEVNLPCPFFHSVHIVQIIITWSECNYRISENTDISTGQKPLRLTVNSSTNKRLWQLYQRGTVLLHPSSLCGGGVAEQYQRDWMQWTSPWAPHGAPFFW